MPRFRHEAAACFCDRGSVLSTGEVAAHGTRTQLLADRDIRQADLGA